MILDNVNPKDLFPTEKKGPTVLGTIEYNVQGQSQFEGAFIATNERLIMNVDMNGQFYYRSISYNEIEAINYDGQTLNFKFNIGNVPMYDFKSGDVDVFVTYIKEHMTV